MNHNLIVDVNIVYIHGSSSIWSCLLISSLIGVFLSGLLPMKTFFLNRNIAKDVFVLTYIAVCSLVYLDLFS